MALLRKETCSSAIKCCVSAYRTEPVTVGEFPVHFILVSQLRAPRSMTFELYSHLFIVLKLEEKTKRIQT